MAVFRWIENADTMYEMSLEETQFMTSKGSLSLWADVLQEDGTSIREKLYEQSVDLMQTRTYIQSVEVVPIDAWGEDVEITVEYIDENGFWTGYSITTYLQGTDGTGLMGYLEESGQVGYYAIYEWFCDGDSLLFELSMDIEGEEDWITLVLYSEDVLIKSGDFDETSGGGYSSDYST